MIGADEGNRAAKAKLMTPLRRHYAGRWVAGASAAAMRSP